MESGKLNRRQLGLGLRSGRDVEVVSGLGGNDWVVLAGASSLQQGQPVELTALEGELGLGGAQRVPAPSVLIGVAAMVPAFILAVAPANVFTITSLGGFTAALLPGSFAPPRSVVASRLRVFGGGLRPNRVAVGLHPLGDQYDLIVDRRRASADAHPVAGFEVQRLQFTTGAEQDSAGPSLGVPDPRNEELLVVPRDARRGKLAHRTFNRVPPAPTILAVTIFVRTAHSVLPCRGPATGAILLDGASLAILTVLTVTLPRLVLLVLLALPTALLCHVQIVDEDRLDCLEPAIAVTVDSDPDPTFRLHLRLTASSPAVSAGLLAVLLVVLNSHSRCTNARGQQASQRRSEDVVQ